ncbi:unnamed protein product [Blumeria hordei]|uniref:Uncharacterized protein n=1 Tax=Blumeria hordei TaxID=2867405 RepID=A0A383UNV3_BLUHO|nr:unnamed protein product [Blumeria hordei]
MAAAITNIWILIICLMAKIMLASPILNETSSSHLNLRLRDETDTKQNLSLKWSNCEHEPREIRRNCHEQNDMDYFAFTPKNVYESQHAIWYANWTYSRQSDPQWLEIGEWRLFSIEYFHTRNLDCGSFWTDCKDMPTWHEILNLYPNDRELARRVYFTSESYLIIRNYLNAIQTILDEVHISLYGMLPEIVQVFTSQPDPSAQSACAMIGAVTDTLVNVGVTAVTGMMTSTLTSFYDKTKLSVLKALHDPEVAATWYTKTLNTKWIPPPVVRWLRNQDQFNAWGEMTPSTSDELDSLAERVSKISQNLPKSNYPPHSKPELTPELKKIKDAYKKAYLNLPWVKPVTQIPKNLRFGLRFNLQIMVKEQVKLRLMSGSIGGGSSCSRFGGSDTNNNAININQVQGQLASVLPQVLDSLGEVYEGIYNGSLSEEGQPSWLATSMLRHNWAEEKSYLARLRHGNSMKSQVMRAFVLNIASQVSAKDGSYMKCSHKSWAAEKCYKMAHAKATDEASLSYFCPRPDTDPGLICQVGRWAFSADNSHETPWPALLKLENFLHDRFQLTRLDVLNDVYDHYELQGNDLQVDWNSWFLGSLSSMGSFSMPVCKNDRLEIKDNTVHGPGRKPLFGKNSWAVPNVCGVDGKETEKFFEEMGFLEGSAPWNSRSKNERWAGGGTNEFYNDRLVRANRDSFKTNPFARYRTMCYQHIRFAEHKDWKRYDAFNLNNHARVHKGRDQDCDLVLEATANMTEEQGNRWFCQKYDEYGNDYGHTVFSRETWKVEINRVPRDWVENHEHDCQKWLKKNGKTPTPPAPVIPGVPREKTGKLWLEAIAAKKQHDEELADEVRTKELDDEAEREFEESLKSMSKKDAEAARKNHKLEQEEANELRKQITEEAKNQNLKKDEDWKKVLREPPQDEYKWKGWKGLVTATSHPIKFIKRIWKKIKWPHRNDS